MQPYRFGHPKAAHGLQWTTENRVNLWGFAGSQLLSWSYNKNRSSVVWGKIFENYLPGSSFLISKDVARCFKTPNPHDLISEAAMSRPDCRPGTLLIAEQRTARFEPFKTSSGLSQEKGFLTIAPCYLRKSSLWLFMIINWIWEEIQCINVLLMCK